MEDGATDARKGMDGEKRAQGKRGSAWVLRAVTWRACSRKRRTGSVRGRARGERRRGAREGTWAWVEGGRENKETAEVRSSACSRQCREGPGERGEVWSEGHEDA